MIYLAWTAAAPPDGLGDGPWSATFALAPGLVLVESEATRSRVYHAVKDALPRDTAMLVTLLSDPPKFKGLSSGAGEWLRTHR